MDSIQPRGILKSTCVMTILGPPMGATSSATNKHDKQGSPPAYPHADTEGWEKTSHLGNICKNPPTIMKSRNHNDSQNIGVQEEGYEKYQGLLANEDSVCGRRITCNTPSHTAVSACSAYSLLGTNDAMHNPHPQHSSRARPWGNERSRHAAYHTYISRGSPCCCVGNIWKTTSR